MSNCKLYVSPVSVEAMRAAYHSGAVHGFCASVGQVGPDAYTGLDMRTFAQLRVACEQETGRRIVVERDHLGRNGECMTEWVERDVAYGFDGCMLHVHEPTHEVMMLLGRYPAYEWQLGPGEDDSRKVSMALKKVMYAHPAVRWVSAPTGCLIESLTNRGAFSPMLVRDYKTQTGKLFRGHNCDYLNSAQLRAVRETCDGFNVAPQIGCVQSCFYLTTARSTGLPIREWEDACWRDAKNRARWCRHEHQAVQAVGHYHFDKIPWRDMVRKTVTEELVSFMRGLVL